MIIITNNPRVLAIKQINIKYLDGTYYDVLEEVKNLVINNKYRILSHPLSGSIKPNETYYKSIMIDNNKYEYTDMESLELIETAIEVYEKFIKNKQRPIWSLDVLDDFAQVDYFLINSAIESANCL